MSTQPTFNPQSFLANRLGIQFILSDDQKHVIGRVSRVARNRFRWSRYAKPVKVTTTAKQEPKEAEVHYVGAHHTAVWAVKLSHHNAIGRAAATSSTSEPKGE